MLFCSVLSAEAKAEEEIRRTLVDVMDSRKVGGRDTARPGDPMVAEQSCERCVKGPSFYQKDGDDESALCNDGNNRMLGYC